MWQYQSTDELYHGKYLRKYLGKNGKYIYVYPKYNNHDDGINKQQSLSIDTKNGNNITLVKGSNKENSYKGISFGKIKDVNKYKETNKKIGNLNINYNNENGQHNITISKENRKNRGKKAIDNIIKKLRKH
jgi:hypothetical protein